jgi:hypothetical protein
MSAPGSTITPGTGSWIWTNPFGRFPSASFSIASTTEIDNYRFQADVTGAYTISVSGGTLDSILRVYNSSGVSIAGPIDTQFAGGTESTTLTLTAGNWYYIGVGGFNTSTGTYSLGINGPTPVINDITTSAPSYSGSFTGASISPAGDIDWFKLVAPAGTTSFSFSTSALSAGLDTVLQLLDSAGNSLLGVVNNAGAGLGDLASSSITAGATYYVGVTSLGSGSYNFNADFGPDQALSILSISPLSADKAEGTNQTTQFTFQVTRTGSTSGTSTVHWAVDFNQSPSANAADFSGGIVPSGDFTWGPNDTSSRTISVGVNGDQTYEGDLPEHFVVILSGQTGATLGTSTANGSIQNDDVAPQPAVLSILALSADKLEGNNQTTAFTFTVTHTGDTSASSSVHWAIGANQSPAADASDFIGATSGTLNWAVGDSSSKTIMIGVNGDTTYEGDLPEHFTVNLSNASGATIGTATANGSIQNDDLGNTVVGSVQPLQSLYGNTQVTLQRIDSAAPIDPNKVTWIILHGRDESFEHSTSNIMWNLAQAVDVATGTAQVLTLDWSSGAGSIFGPADFHGETYIQPIAQWLAAILNSNGFAGSNINVIGHSWGGVMAAEFAASMTSVNTIIALDPAEDATPAEGGTSYNTNNISFAAHSSFSWAFYSRDGGPAGNLLNAGNEETPTTASEAFVVTNSSHDGVVSLFKNMLPDTNGTVSQYFQLARLASHSTDPWTFDAYDFNGNPASHGGYEAVITTTNNGTAPLSIIGVPEIAVSFSGINITDNDASPTSTDGTDFGTVTQGAVVDRVFTVNNSGTGTLTISGIIVPAGFTVVEPLSSSIAAGGFDNFTVRLDTSSAGAKNGQITLTDNDIDENPFNFSITGAVNATSTSEISVSGNSTSILDGDTTPSGTDLTDFGSVTLGNAAIQHTFTVSNTGTGTLTTSALTVPSGFTVVEGLSASIPAGGSDTFTVQLDTTSVGTKSGGQISFTTNDGDENPFNFSITGAVNATSTPEISVSGNSTNILDGDTTPSSTDLTDFGGATQGGSAVQHTFTVSNTGTGTLTTSGLLLPTGYSVVEGLSSSIQAGSFDTFTVRLDTSSTGTKGGQISFTTNDGDENPFNFSITGTVNATPTPEIAVSGGGADIPDGDLSPASSDGTDFGTAAQGVTVDRVFTVSNIGTGTLTTAGLLLPGGYTLVEGLSSSIPAGNSDTFTVRLDTSSVGTKSGPISFITNDSDENPFNFSVTGTVNETPLNQPDLTVSNLSIAQAAAHPGQTITIDYDLNNIGSVGAAGFELGFYISTDPTVDRNDELFAYSPNASQLANSSTHHHGTAPLPDDLTPGLTYYVGIIADDTDVIPNELHENNNVSNVVSIAVNSVIDAQAGSVSINDVSITEGNNGTKIETFTVTRSGGTAAFDVSFNTSDGSATTADGDYIAKAGALHFDTGVNKQTISVTIIGDTKIESNETFSISLSGATDGAIISDNLAISTIVDDDGNHARDFNGDFHSDILWQNAGGTPATWLMNGTSVATYAPALANPGPAWHEKAAADFNGDGKADILWQNDNGAPTVWLMDGANVAAYGPALANPGPTWHATAAADFNGDGKADILWQNDNGTPAVWLMDGANVAAYGAPLANPGPTWHEKAAADFNGDGKADILWQNDNGAAAVWLMDGANVASYGPALANPGPTWHATAAADFNGDGKADILWQNDNGTPAVWLMDGTNVAAYGPALANPGPAWHEKAAADFNGNGKADILWQNDNGTPAVWLMDGTNVAAYGPALANPGSDWHII